MERECQTRITYNLAISIVCACACFMFDCCRSTGRSAVSKWTLRKWWNQSQIQNDERPSTCTDAYLWSIIIILGDTKCATTVHCAPCIRHVPHQDISRKHKNHFQAKTKNIHQRQTGKKMIFVGFSFHRNAAIHERYTSCTTTQRVVKNNVFEWTGAERKQRFTENIVNCFILT